MKVILETERMRLREFIAEDAEPFFQLNNDPEVIRYTGDKAFESVNAARTFLVNYPTYKEYGYGRWAMILKSHNEFIGWCGLKMYLGEIDVGYRIFKKYWNQGYATEAAKASLVYGLNELKMTRIVGRAARENIASIRVMEKIGMTFEKYEACDHIEDAVHYVIERI